MSQEPAVASAPLTKKDFVTQNDVRWCPGCGDYAILNSIQKTFPELGVPKENFVVISGIGCSSRFPYYMETFGFHTIHGRAPTVATGVKVANPNLSVWMVTGDGDALSIGGNHLLHILRRNLDINILLFNNRVYGLTKGQYSPTSSVGMKTKTTPMGSFDHPVNPIQFALGAEATFVARTVDTDPKHMVETFQAAHAHKGTSFVEIFQNCVIFNKDVWEDIYGRGVKDDQILYLEEGKPLLFGKEKNRGIRLNGLDPEVVTIGENGITENDILVHNPSSLNPLQAALLSQLLHPEFPTPLGVLKSIQRDVYEDCMDGQVKAAKDAKGQGDLQATLAGAGSWVVE
jgi:2-oxoglutarate ferredoxin oxidoreductase subunit beta